MHLFQMRWYSDDLNKIINFEIFRDQSQSMYYNNGKSIQEQLMFADINLYMVDDILTKVDRASRHFFRIKSPSIRS